MIPRKVLLTSLLLIVFFHSIIIGEKEVQEIYIRGVQCNFSARFVHQNYSCFPKSYNRSFSTVNVITTNKKPTYGILIFWSIQYKYGTIYREVIHSPFDRLDWCKLARDSTDNKLVQVFLGVMSDSVPGFLEKVKCPIKGLNFTNVFPKTSSLLSAFPTDDYKLIIYFSRRNGEEIGAINIIGTLKSSNRDTFG